MFAFNLFNYAILHLVYPPNFLITIVNKMHYGLCENSGWENKLLPPSHEN